jgi:hypothetical protein
MGIFTFVIRSVIISAAVGAPFMLLLTLAEINQLGTPANSYGITIGPPRD